MQMPDKIVLRSVESLIPYARNARTHSDAQVAQADRRQHPRVRVHQPGADRRRERHRRRPRPRAGGAQTRQSWR